MRIAGEYSFNRGREALESEFAAEWQEIKQVITGVKSRALRVLYEPESLKEAFRREMATRHWRKHRVACELPVSYYTPSYKPSTSLGDAFREIDFVRNRVGVEVHLKRHTSMLVCSVCAQMTIFHNMGVIDAGVVIAPVEDFANRMSVGVSCFEQFVWDLEQRGVSNIDIPVLILGIAA
jgi:hypothetical protein